VKKALSSVLITGLLLGAVQMAAAQKAAAPQPVAVVSIAGIDSILKDVNTLANAAGLGAEAAPLALAGAQAQAFGLDTKKPWGAVVFLNTAAPKGFAFIPVSNFQQLLNMGKALNVPIVDAGNGLYSVVGPQGNKVFLKEQNGWLFVAPSEDNLADLPADPSTLLEGLNKLYTFAIKANIKNVPADMRNQLVSLIKAGAQGGLRRLPGEDETQFNLRQKMIDLQIDQFGTVLDQTEQFTLGWSTDSVAKKTAIDINMTAIAGSELAKRYASSAIKSDFNGFNSPDSAATLHFAQKMDADSIKQVGQALENARANAMKGIDNDNSIPNEDGKKMVKEIVNQLFDVAKATIEAGKIDGGAVLHLAGKNLTFAAGAAVADGAAIESALKKLVEIAKNEPDFPGVNFDVEKYQGIRFHTTSIPNPDPQAQQIFGEKIDVALGIGDKSAYLAVGKDTIKTLKSIIDKSAAATSENTLPAEFAISLGQVLNFTSQFDQNPVLASVAAEVAKVGAQDHVRVQSKSIPNGATAHIEVEEGVLRAIGAGIKSGMGGRAGGGAAPNGLKTF
jgi:hypothetical protein